MNENNERPERGHRDERRRRHGPEGEQPGSDFEGRGRFERPHPDERGPEFERRGFPGHRGRDQGFWEGWRQHYRGHEGDFEPGAPLPPKEMEVWREYFHQSFGAWPEEHWVFGGRRFSPWHQGVDAYNPFIATLLSKGGGLLPLYALHLVAQQPRYGNEIMEILAEQTNGQWISNPGAIYPLLSQLEREGFIEGEWEDAVKRSIRVYTITAKGQAELERLKSIVAPKLAETIQMLDTLLHDLQGEPPAETATAASDPSAPAPDLAQPQ